MNSFVAPICLESKHFNNKSAHHLYKCTSLIKLQDLITHNKADKYLQCLWQNFKKWHCENKIGE